MILSLAYLASAIFSLMALLYISYKDGDKHYLTIPDILLSVFFSLLPVANIILVVSGFFYIESNCKNPPRFFERKK